MGMRMKPAAVRARAPVRRLVVLESWGRELEVRFELGLEVDVLVVAATAAAALRRRRFRPPK